MGDIDFENKKAVLFDNDGVLTHTEGFYLDLYLEVMRDVGAVYTRDDFIQHVFLTNLGSQGWLVQAGYGEDVQSAFKAKKDSRVHAGLIDGTTCDPAVTNVIAALKRKLRLAVVTNTNREFFDVLTRKFTFLNELDLQVVREDYSNPKPAPDGYLAALSKLGVTAKEAVVIEDSPRGIAAAKAADIEVIGIRNPDFPELDLSEADMQIDSLSDLLQLVN